jgi:hypothetical protein
MTVFQFIGFHRIKRDAVFLERKGRHRGPLQYTETEFVSTVCGDHRNAEDKNKTKFKYWGETLTN